MIGDALMLRCADAARAITLGLRIVEEICARPQFPVVRVGMHTGPAVARDGDWFGATVNLAARVAAAAEGGELLLTEATRTAAGTVEGAELHRRGPERFKNLAEEVTVYRATVQGPRSGDLPIDPVCRMTVAQGRAAGHLEYEGVEYHFCSLKCAEAFAGDPDRYVGGRSSGSS